MCKITAIATAELISAPWINEGGRFSWQKQTGDSHRLCLWSDSYRDWLLMLLILGLRYTQRRRARVWELRFASCGVQGQSPDHGWSSLKLIKCPCFTGYFLKDFLYCCFNTFTIAFVRSEVNWLKWVYYLRAFDDSPTLFVCWRSWRPELELVRPICYGCLQGQLSRSKANAKSQEAPW